MSFVYINNKFVPEAEARVSAFDRGFRYGDGVFETIAVQNGVMYQWEAHLMRLKESLTAVRISLNLADYNLKAICNTLIGYNHINEGIVRITITRGIGGTGYLPAENTSPMIIIDTKSQNILPKQPVQLWLSSLRKIPAQCLPVQAKTMQGLNSTLARMEAAENGCFEAILLNMDGIICECSSSNIFWLKGDTLYTPALSCGILAGTTRAEVIRQSPFKVEEGSFPIENLYEADEVFITNVSWRILSIDALLPKGKEYLSTKTKRLAI